MTVFCRFRSKHPLSLWCETIKSGTYTAPTATLSPPILVESCQM
jgi:hypothetical protein